MIAHLTGTLFYKSPLHVIVDVNGVGYQVHVPLSTYYALPDKGNPVSLRIYTHMREEALRLFGFLTAEEQMLFEKLIAISKVGPKLALTILSGMSTQVLVRAVIEHDIARLSSIPGVGRKTAERLSLEMKDKLGDLALEPSPGAESAPTNGVIDDALSALVNLGYKKAEAERVLNKLVQKSGKELAIEDLIKESLNVLS